MMHARERGHDLPRQTTVAGMTPDRGTRHDPETHDLEMTADRRVTPVVR
jgi:hypothetical protein